MTDNEIIKALERCGMHRECCYCNSVEECGNKRVLTASTLDLINRQKAEIERLQKAGKEAVNCFTRMGTLYKIKCKELEVAKSEAIKEFAERLKEMATSTFYEERKYVDTEDIDNLVKEMEGGSNE